MAIATSGEILSQFLPLINHSPSLPPPDHAGHPLRVGECAGAHVVGVLACMHMCVGACMRLHDTMSNATVLVHYYFAFALEVSLL